MTLLLRRIGWVLLAVGPTLAAAQDSTALKLARITYLTSSTAYLDAGRLDGLREAMRVEVRRAGATVGVLRVAFLASHQASCDIVSQAAPLAVGDSARFVPAAAPPRDSAAAPVTAGRGAASAASRRSGPGLRGRLAAQYFWMRQRDGTAGGLSQPSFDVRLDGPPPPFSGPAVRIAVDVRARRTYTILPDGTAVTDGRSRVYQASLSAATAGAGLRVTAGRQISGDLASIGLFDGMMAEVIRPAWAVGAFAGTQPEPLHLGFSGDIIEGGGYLQRHNGPGAPTPWTLTVGVSGSYQDNHANREFLYLQANYLGSRLTGFVTQEVDYYRGWKRLPGMAALSPTSTLAIVQLRADPRLAFDAGFDNRRNVRLYRDVVNPETQFDDTYRQGMWGGVTLQPVARVRLGLEARTNSGDPAGRADAYTATLGADRFSPLALSLRTRSTRYSNPLVSGWLHSLSVGGDPSGRLRVELNGGVRAERGGVTGARTTARWVGTSVDLTFQRAWLLMFSGTWQRGGIEGYDQIFAGGSYRF